MSGTCLEIIFYFGLTYLFRKVPSEFETDFPSVRVVTAHCLDCAALTGADWPHLCSERAGFNTL